MEPQYPQFADSYQIISNIDFGAQGEVYLAKKDKKLYALKVYVTKPGKIVQKISNEQMQRLIVICQRQAYFLKGIHHPYLINFIEVRLQCVVVLDNAPKRILPTLVLEYAQKEVLYQYLSCNKRIQPKIWKRFIKMLIEVVQYLDEKGITHQDIKPENILFDNQFNLKLADFGHSAPSKDQNGYITLNYLKKAVGTENYRMPQIKQFKDYTGIQCDIYSIGATLFTCHMGCFVFDNESSIKDGLYYKKIVEGDFQGYWINKERQIRKKQLMTKQFKMLMEQFLNPDRSKRPTIKKLLENQWLNEGVADQKQYRKQMERMYNSILQKKSQKKRKNKIARQIIEKQIEQLNNPNPLVRNDQSNFVKQYLVCLNIDIPISQKTHSKVVLARLQLPYLLAWLYKYLIDLADQNKDQWFSTNQIPKLIQYQVIQNVLTIKFALFNVVSEKNDIFIIQGQLIRFDHQIVGIQWIRNQEEHCCVSHLIMLMNAQIKQIN